LPEGNEIHRYADLQNTHFAGTIVRVDAPNGRFAEGALLLDKRKLRAVEAFGKHLFYNFGNNRQLHVHLGLYGKFRDGEMPYPEPKGALRIRISNAAHWLELRGPTACDVLSSEAREKLLARIGPDPLRPDADPTPFITRVTRSRAPIAALLMDQAVVGGNGNIYRAELLHRARISPFAKGTQITAAQLTALWQDARTLMQAGITDRRIVTTRPADRPHPKGKARRGEIHYVYRRQGQPCFLCGTEISMREFVGRKLYWCRVCQRFSTASQSSSSE
jgi:formamidopyrimidine-DNA glycosylase